ncbi:MAG: DUF6382 domain-containing protein [Coprococcus sp.]
MNAEQMYLCDEYKLYFKIEDDVDVLHNEIELYNTSFVGNNSFCHEEYIDGQRALVYSMPAMITMNQFITKKIHKDELLDIMFSITDQLMYLKANELSIGKVILSTGYMYIDLNNMAVQMVFLPIDKQMDKCNMEKFVRELISHLTFANKKASDCAYELIKYFDHNKVFYLSEFYKFIIDFKNDNIAHPEDERELLEQKKASARIEVAESVSSGSAFKLAKEKRDYSENDIGFDDADDDSTTVLTGISRSKGGPVIIRTKTGERIRIDKPIFCIGKSTQGVDYQIVDNNSVSRRHAYIINVNGVYYLRDNKSTNHTYLGGKLINSGTDMMLIDGSRFKLANEEFTFKEK